MSLQRHLTDGMDHLHVQATVAQLVQVAIFLECEVAPASIDQKARFVIDNERRSVRRRGSDDA